MKHRVEVRRCPVDIHRDQGIVERFNRTLAERLFEHQQAQELLMTLSERSREWVKRLSAVIAALNGKVMRLTRMRPSYAIRAQSVVQKPSSMVPGSPVGFREQKLPSGAGVRYLYQPGELEGGCRQATDPVWSLDVYRPGGSKGESEILFRCCP